MPSRCRPPERLKACLDAPPVLNQPVVQCHGLCKRLQIFWSRRQCLQPRPDVCVQEVVVVQGTDWGMRSLRAIVHCPSAPDPATHIQRDHKEDAASEDLRLGYHTAAIERYSNQAQLPTRRVTQLCPKLDEATTAAKTC